MCGKRLSDFLHYMCRHYGGFQTLESKRSEENGLSTGIVDECCRKQCALSTLISYCANGENAANERLLELESLFSSNAEAFREIQAEENTMEMMANNPDSARNSHVQVNAGTNIPNIGTNNRNRPVFIVLPQAYEAAGSDTSPEENNGHSF
ncbi:bombyxin B-2 [Trichonephila inaurata madagascariensis]|uniref:Bombyxin B-2 n=1 Tax=Trichonephila inaurata madagascariensis TaxID=2747483 RepID=A0A8X6XV23_9ARAC|nr:bombyxin B-2 [Trichonephila inaurata madagascariensis]